MAQTGEGFAVGDMVLILDLSVTLRQPPFPALGTISKFLNKEKGQAEINYNFKNGRHSVVNRPLSLISKIVSATEDIPPQGLLFDPLIVNDFLQQEDAERLEAELAGDGERGDEDGGGHADTDQQVGRGELGAVQDVTAAISEDGLESAQDQGEQASEEGISKGDISGEASEDDSSDQTGQEQAKEANSPPPTSPPPFLPSLLPPHVSGELESESERKETNLTSVCIYNKFTDVAL